MKHLSLAVVAAAALATAASAQDAALGIWQTEVDDGAYAYVELEQCGEAVCGNIIRTFNADGEYESPNIGRQIVIDMVNQGDDTYRGNVWRPSNDRIYIGRMALDSNHRLTLRGCVAGGLLCARQRWARID